MRIWSKDIFHTCIGKETLVNPHYSQFIYSKAKLTAVYGNAQKY